MRDSKKIFDGTKEEKCDDEKELTEKEIVAVQNEQTKEREISSPKSN
jgi:hypothetical protein